MLTRGFYEYLYVLLKQDGLSRDITTVKKGECGVTFGNIADVYKSSVSNAISFANSLKKFTGDPTTSDGVVFGTSNVAPTLDDYTIANPLTSNEITVTTPSDVSQNMGESCMEITATFGVYAKETVTIKEMGLVVPIWKSSSSVSLALFDRTILAEPVTINKGESKQLIYTIRFDYPTV